MSLLSCTQCRRWICAKLHLLWSSYSLITTRYSGTAPCHWVVGSIKYVHSWWFQMCSRGSWGGFHMVCCIVQNEAWPWSSLGMRGCQSFELDCTPATSFLLWLSSFFMVYEIVKAKEMGEELSRVSLEISEG